MPVQRWVALDPDELKDLDARCRWWLEDKCRTVVVTDGSREGRGHTLKQAYDALHGRH